MLFEIDDQQSEELNQNQYEENVSNKRRKISAVEHEIAELEQLDQHRHEESYTKTEYDDVLHKIEILAQRSIPSRQA